MENDDEDVVTNGTDLQKYLTAIGCTEFEVSSKNEKKSKNVEQLNSLKSNSKESKYSRKINRHTQNFTKDLELCIALIKIILESQLMFKEDTLFVKEFIPSNDIKYSYITLFFTKRNSCTLFLLCIFYGISYVFSSKYCNEWMAASILIIWFSYVFIEALYNSNKKLKIKHTICEAIESMKKLSLLIQKITHFIRECNNLHSVYNNCNDMHISKNTNSFTYLLMPELKSVFLTIIQSLIDNLISNISEVHTFFPLKDSIINNVNLFLSDCKIDLQNTSLDNINKGKYTFFLLQSEFLKQSTLCLSPITWTSKSFLQMNNLINTIKEVKNVYSNYYTILSEEYNVYSLFRNNNSSYNKHFSCNNDYSDIKLKIYSVKQSLQNIMVNIRFMEDSIENSTYCINDMNNTLSILVKEANNFNQLISSLQIYVLKTNSVNKSDDDILITNSIEEIDNNIKNNEHDNIICEDQLFFGISEEITEKIDHPICDDEVFDKSNNHNFMLELKIALKDKQEEWKERESKLLELNPQLNQLFKEDSNDEKCDQYNTIRKVPSDFSSDEQIPYNQLPNLADEIAKIASQWNTAIESFSDNSDSEVSINSSDS